MYRTSTLAKTIAQLTLIFALMALWPSAARAQYGGGSGTAEDPYLIYTPEQMDAIGQNQAHWSKHFMLMADLDLSAYEGESFHLIGYYSPVDRGAENVGFSGVFDGNGHTISNFTYLFDANEPRISTGDGFASSQEAAFGLFRILWPSAEIKNLGLIDPLVQPTPESTEWIMYVGALVGLSSGTITNCYVEGGKVVADSYVGGLVGYCHRYSVISHCYTTCNVAHAAGRPFSDGGTSAGVGGLAGYNEGEIRNCYATGNIWSVYAVGGLVGVNDMLNAAGQIVNCFATGAVSGREMVGGLVGQNVGYVLSSYATGTVSGDRDIGGLVGRLCDADFYFIYYGEGGEDAIPTLEHCYAAGLVSGTKNAGGLLGGLGQTNEISGCFWDMETTEQEGSSGGTGQSTAQMQEKTTYLEAGWDFLGESDNGADEIWTIDSNQPVYPRLVWSLIDPNDPNGTTILSYGPDVYESVIIYETTLDTDPGWTTDGQWQFGIPTGQGAEEHGYPDPTSGYTGENVYGVNLDGDYALVADGPHHLTVGPFDCTDYRDVKIAFARWLNTDQGDFVYAAAEYSTDRIYWTPLWKHDSKNFEFTEDAWTVVQAYATQADGQSEVWFRWSYEVYDEEAWAMSGWNIDDVVISARKKVSQTHQALPSAPSSREQ